MAAMIPIQVNHMDSKSSLACTQFHRWNSLHGFHGYRAYILYIFIFLRIAHLMYIYQYSFNRSLNIFQSWALLSTVIEENSGNNGARPIWDSSLWGCVQAPFLLAWLKFNHGMDT